VTVEEDDPKRDERVLHPEAATRRLREDEEHPVLRCALAAHEPDAARLHVERELRPEDHAVEPERRASDRVGRAGERTESDQEDDERSEANGHAETIGKGVSRRR
jgi:predicted  nucleic acid-binding Zn-ribbon protein